MSFFDSAKEKLQQVSEDHPDQVEQLIKLLLPSGRASIQTCAASMGMTVRTLQRALDSEGHSSPNSSTAPANASPGCWAARSRTSLRPAMSPGGAPIPRSHRPRSTACR